MSESTLEINFNNIEDNIKILAKDKKACLMVKAQSYGLGFEMIEQLIEMGYDYFGVTTLSEADEIRAINEKVDILIVAPIDLEKETQSYEITITDISSLKKIDQNQKFHLKFDTGMGRIGFQIEEIAKIKEIVEKRDLKITGIFSHLAVASDEETSSKQIRKLKEITESFLEYNIKYIHIQNTMGCLLYDIDICNMVRPGLGIWGYVANKSEYEISKKKLKPSIKLTAKKLHSKYYDGLIGYDHSESVKGNVVTIRIGYADGIPRTLQGYKIEQKYQIIGKICMCQLMLKTIDIKDEYKVFENEDVYELVNYAQITVYELLTSLSSRLERKIIK